LEVKARIPGWLVPASLAACLLNPHTYHVFMLPAEISPATWTSGLRGDIRYQPLFSSPWTECLTALKALHLIDLAYFGLTLAGVLSFVLNHQALRSWRLLVWLPFAALAAWQQRLIPFFAVVAAPITTLNLQDFLAARAEKKTGRPVGSALFLVLLSRCLLVLVLLALPWLGWLGWLSGIGREERHVAWNVQPDPSLRQAAEVLRMWRSEGLLKDNEHVFAVAPELGSYTAWFSPDEKQFFDQRYSLFAHVAPEYEAVHAALDAESATARRAPPRSQSERGKDWREVFKDHGIAIVVYHERDPLRLTRVLSRLAADPEHWTLLNISGQSVIAGWNEARPPGGFATLSLDPEQLAFGPQNNRARSELPAAPERGPGQLPQRRDFMERLTGPPPPPTWESTAATLYLSYYDETREEQRKQRLRASWNQFAASLTGLPALPSAIPQAIVQLYSSRNLPFQRDVSMKFLTRDELGPFFARTEERSPACLMLVIRAARRAIATNPSDSVAWYRLGVAYLALLNDTYGRLEEAVLPPLYEIRYVQIVTALEEALRLNPDLEDAHYQLYFLYGQRNYLDQALDHGKEVLRLTRRAGRRSGESEEEYADRMEFIQTEVNQTAEIVQDRREKYIAGSPSLQGERMTQTNMALKLGLGRQALDGILLATPADVLGAPGIKLELELMLMLGRVEEVRTILSDRGLRANKHTLRQSTLAPPKDKEKRSAYPVPYVWSSYETLHLLQSAAVGDYAHAREDLQTIRAELMAKRDAIQQQLRNFDNRVWTFLPSFLSGPSPILPTLAALDLRRTMNEKQLMETGALALRAQITDLLTVEGLLALEQGNTDAAHALFDEATRLGSDASDHSVPSVGAPIAGYYLSKTKVGR
jgi:tetratricopeptide (TPR) repeat protein